mmetsp:Transcript_28060/g.84083  ORF Transcript_28060/g.84083 Transcript_28060/m.84083 type:complete len:209 (+) Transcript_28060:546-1172(+)
MRSTSSPRTGKWLLSTASASPPSAPCAARPTPTWRRPSRRPWSWSSSRAWAAPSTRRRTPRASSRRRTCPCSGPCSTARRGRASTRATRWRPPCTRTSRGAGAPSMASCPSARSSRASATRRRSRSRRRPRPRRTCSSTSTRRSSWRTPRGTRGTPSGRRRRGPSRPSSTPGPSASASSSRRASRARTWRRSGDPPSSALCWGASRAL